MSESTAEQLRRLADIVEQIDQDDEDLAIEDATLLGFASDADRIHARLVVSAPLDGAVQAESLSEFEEKTPSDVDDEPAEEDIDEADDPDDVDEPESADEDDDDRPEEIPCPLDGCDYTGNERGVAIHKGRSHTDEEIGAGRVLDEDGEDDDRPDLDDVFAALCEVSGGEWVQAGAVADRLDESGVLVGRRLRDLRDDGIVEKRSVNASINEWRPAEAGAAEDDEQTPPSEDVDNTSEAPNDDLEAEGQGDGADGPGAAESEEITVDSVDDPPDEPQVALPDDVTEADVQGAADEHETLGDVADALDVTRGRARALTVALDCYGDVRDVPSRRGDA